MQSNEYPGSAVLIHFLARYRAGATSSRCAFTVSRRLREERDQVLRAVWRFSEREYGPVYLSPGFLDFSLHEIGWRVRHGPMAGIG
jgi:hypothetical protein